ncbi:hypothetical protein DNH61_20330 [Paenibacillus sambharensis]|uniref:Uncharacterized protein n=1 Tax=Paenibacillus sambharensis TaxID=1803190 RepID=A0A2W1L4M5_9BACL|nr:hypothetical protein DNH61_20330 [Paenibacillus sambharensis]
MISFQMIIVTKIWTPCTIEDILSIVIPVVLLTYLVSWGGNMKSNKNTLWWRLLLQFPLWIFLIVFYISLFWLTGFFETLGLAPKNFYYLHIVVIITYLIGLSASELQHYVESKYK